ncbi:MAG: hypothetical protein PQJ59_10040 [Spirochaetales bacterium]|nr:hypothetical protein [Spirochaetales bacterium]
MKRRVLFLFLLVAVASLLSAEITLPFSMDFDSLSRGDNIPGGRIRGDADSIPKIVTIISHSGTNSLFMADYSTTDSSELIFTLPEGMPRGTVKYAFYLPAIDPGLIYCTLGTSTNSSGRVVDVQITSKGNIRCRKPEDQSLETVSEGISYDTWHTVEISWDISTNQYLLYVNGVSIAQKVLISNEAPTHLIFKVGSDAKSAHTAYLDDISLRIE